MGKKGLIALAITVLVVLLDQISKAWILAGLRLHDGFPLIDGFVNIVHVRNPGAAFGFLAGAAPMFRHAFFIAVPALAILLILNYLRKSRIEDPAQVSALALILAGAVGNLIDRIRFGEVVDFLDVYVGTYHWPAFNVADSAVTIGAAILIILLIRKPRERTEGE
jgi:signal peptidase II